MKRKIIFILILVLAASIGINSKSIPKQKAKIQLAILLDTSGSMEGLIEQAKSQLWKIVNELANTKKNGKSPDLEVALYEYGKSTISVTENYLRMIVPLTNDLDTISEELFKLKTNGGSEYCGAVIDSAIRELKWTKDNDDYKVIFIAGNEPFTQGQISYKAACNSAIKHGITVNTIFCGSYNEGIKTKWKDGAELTDGRYMNINHNDVIVHISTPYDLIIIKLGKQLNNTYISYGKSGLVMKERQKKQDKNAIGLSPSSMVQRTFTKSSHYYKNTKWDMVDAQKEGKIKIESLKEEYLPEEMKKMTVKERKEYIEKKRVERMKIQKKIKELKMKRDAFLTQKRKAQAGQKTLDSAIIKAIKTQIKKKNYKFEKK